jgi:hypothetical protein
VHHKANLEKERITGLQKVEELEQKKRTIKSARPMSSSGSKNRFTKLL